MKTRSLTTSDTFSLHSSNWFGEQFLQLLARLGIETYLSQGLEIKNRKRVLDFTVVPGKISAKIQLEGDKTDFIDLQVQTFSDEEWNRVLEELAMKSFFFANLLIGEVPLEIEETFANKIGKSLVPNTLHEIRLSSSCEDAAQLKLAGAALFWKFWERLGVDPFMIFTMRGIGRDETISRLRKMRGGVELPIRDQGSAQRYRGRPQTLPSEGFWDIKVSLEDLRFSIRADELPAALLKRLDPLPLAGLEETVEPLLETAYADVARRAQAYGLGLSRRGNVSAR